MQIGDGIGQFFAEDDEEEQGHERTVQPAVDLRSPLRRNPSDPFQSVQQQRGQCSDDEEDDRDGLARHLQAVVCGRGEEDVEYHAVDMEVPYAVDGEVGHEQQVRQEKKKQQQNRRYTGKAEKEPQEQPVDEVECRRRREQGGQGENKS